jgi:hypothetical protein
MSKLIVLIIAIAMIPLFIYVCNHQETNYKNTELNNEDEE